MIQYFPTALAIARPYINTGRIVCWTIGQYRMADGASDFLPDIRFSVNPSTRGIKTQDFLSPDTKTPV
jgi:hypothetical protein